jgi:hypothetical protein
VFFAVLGGLIFYLESFKVLRRFLSTSRTSNIWEGGSGASMTPIFLGLCAIAGAMLLGSVKPRKESEIIKGSE